MSLTNLAVTFIWHLKDYLWTPACPCFSYEQTRLYLSDHRNTPDQFPITITERNWWFESSNSGHLHDLFLFGGGFPLFSEFCLPTFLLVHFPQNLFVCQSITLIYINISVTSFLFANLSTYFPLLCLSPFISISIHITLSLSRPMIFFQHFSVSASIFTRSLFTLQIMVPYE